MAGAHHPHLRDNSVRLDNMENSMYAPPLPSPSTLPQDPQLTSALLDTKIDWTTYMQQVSLFLSGERDYSNLKGDTGPLVYPAGHVYIYSGLYYLTDEGRNIKVAQCIFMLLYLGTLAVVMQCYRLAKVQFNSTLERGISWTLTRSI
jgi:hypothetical protein